MSDFFGQLADILTSLGTWGYLLIALIVFFETVIAIGQFLPGSVLLAFVGFLCYLQTFDITAMFFVVFLAHYAGEQLNYFLGKIKGAGLFREDALVLRPSLLAIVEQQLQKWGAVYFIICQFSGVLRPVLSFLAGSSRYSWIRFSLWLLPACAIWSIVHLGIGFVLGASWQEAANYVEEFSLLAAVTLISLGAAVWLSRTILALAGTTARNLERVAREIADSDFYRRLRQKSPFLFSFAERRLSLTARWGWYATIRFVFVGSLVATVVGLGVWTARSSTLSYMDAALVNFLVQVRRPNTADLLSFISAFGIPAAVLSAAGLAAAAYLVAKQWKSACVILSSPTLATIICYFTKIIIHRPRPLTDMPIVPLSYSFPSTHTAICTAFLLANCYLIWQTTPDRRVRVAWASLCLTLALLVGYSRVYLALHYATDVIGGLLVGLASFLFCSTVAGQLNVHENHHPGIKTLVAALSTLGLVTSATALPPRSRSYAGEQPMLSKCSRDFPQLEMVHPLLPRYATRLTGTPGLATNVIVVGQIEPVVQELKSRGWEYVAPQAFYTREIKAPIFPAFVDARPAAFTLVERSENERHVLRLWQTGLCVQQKPVWIGALIGEKLKRRFLTLEIYAVDADIDLVLERWCNELSMCRCTIVHGFRKRGLYHTTHPFFTHGIAAVIETHARTKGTVTDGSTRNE
ncbi:MAG: phosphatase PAP2 family protein [Candidatus Sumerlaeaceae bacterium]|nr:phosphatase PAP2 family protein [Candidatus Sumerlaeaceae bacterium]